MSDRIITPKGRLSFPHLFEKHGFEGQEPKYSTAMVFEEGTDITALKKAALAAAQEKWGDKLKGAKIKTLDTQYGPATFLVNKALRIRLPWRDQEEALEDKGYPAGSTFITFKSDRRPGVVTIFPDPANDNKPSRLEDESKVYPGVYARVSTDAWTYDVSGNKGVSFGLGGVQIIGGGEPFSASFVDPQDEFDADEDAVAEMDPDMGAEDEDEDEDEGGDDLSDLLG